MNIHGPLSRQLDRNLRVPERSRKARGTGADSSGSPTGHRKQVIVVAKAKKSPAHKSSTRRRTSADRRKRSGRKWSARVTRDSDALDLERKVFAQRSPKQIAASLKRSAEHSKRRKSSPFRSAMSMLTFYINRAGKNLSPSKKKTLNKAKDELREQFGRA
jgi:hypothetical protein